MKHYWWSAILFRIFLPCAILIASFIRPTITSYIYTVMGCYMPFFSVPTSKTMAGSTGSYLKLLITVCLLMCLMVYSSWLVLFFFTEPQYYFEPCSNLETFIRTVGVISIANLPLYESIIWCIPEPLMLLVCIFLYFGFKNLTKEVTMRGKLSRKDKAKIQTREINRKKLLKILFGVGKYVTCLMLCITATLKPSAFGAVYYVMFLTLLTYWACDCTLGRVFARILACLIPIIFLNITIMIVYQFQYFHDSQLFSTESIWGRLFHLVDLKTYKDCTDPRIFKFYPHSKATYAMPVCLFVLYQLVILVAREILEAKDGISSLLLVFFRCDRSKVAARWRQVIMKVKDNIEDRKALAISRHLMADRVKYLMIQTMHLLMTVAYVFANIVTMVWAITYVSWSSLILLFWANIVWLLPFRRKVMLNTSPFLVFFMLILLLTAYAYSLDLTRDELPIKIGIFDFSILVPNIGSSTSQEKWATLLTKSLLAFVVFASMRQYFRERSLKKQDASSIFGRTSIMLAVKARLNTSFMSRFQDLMFQFLGLWWIWVVTITMIGIVFWSKLTLFKIVFVGFVIIFLMTFQILAFNTWKKFLKIYWWIAVIYALANLLLLYMSQIEGTRDFLQKYLSQHWYEAFHFEIYDNTTDRFGALAWPLFLQIAILIQQNFFQEEFNRITSAVSPEELAEEEEELKEKNSVWSKLVIFFRKIRDVLFAFLEAYLLNLILLIGWYMCLYDMSAAFVPVVLLLIGACLFGNAIARPVVHLISFYVQMLIILRLIYMNQYRDHHEWNYTGEYGENSSVTLNSADWFGFHQSRKDMNNADFWQLAWCFGYVFSVVVHRIVTIRMANYRFSRELPKPIDIVMFPDITWKNCHDTTGNLLKFLANYGFYKFGCEITLVFASIVLAVRMDAIAILISLWLLVLFALSRKWTKRLWLVFVIFLAILVLLEYVSTLGWWPKFFNKSLTEFWNSKDLHLRLQQFCQISNLARPPPKSKINLDFLLLLLACKQWFVFRKELNNDTESLAGSNRNVCDLIEDPLVENPVPDFMTNTETVIDSYKNIFFNSGLYIALIAIFLAGTLRLTLFSFGNIIASFIFLWEGSDMFLRPVEVILRRWNFLIAYNIVVMIARSASQIYECILIYEDNLEINCKISRLFTIGCIDNYNMIADIPGASKCKVVKTVMGLGWDCFSFFCLICQQRIFKSFHFFHIVNNAKAQTILADRGAILIEEQRREKRTAIDVERVALEGNIKLKMQRIRENSEEIEEIRQGVYYQFDQVEEQLDIPLVPDKEEEESDYESFDPMPLPEYFGLYHSLGMESVLETTALRQRRKKILRQKLASAKKPLDSKSSPSVGASRLALSETRKSILVFKFIWGAFESLIVSTTNVINRRTKKFRYILKQMHSDLKILQEKTNFTQGTRLGKKKIWHPSQSYKDILSDFRKQSSGLQGTQFSIYEKLIKALWYLLMAYSEWLCYFVIILNQTLRCTFLSIPLVMMVFCWGALTVPNPTKTFWIISIAYVLIMVFIKNSFTIGLSPWQNIRQRDNLFFPPEMLGLYNRLKILNLSMMLLLLFHRLVLQMLGQWKPLDARTISLIKPGEYSLQNGQLVPETTTGTSKQPLVLQNAEIAWSEYFPKSVLHGGHKYAEGIILFVQQLISPSSTQIPVDVYTPMFFCDLINIFLLMFFYGSFWGKKQKAGIIKIVSESTVPISFLIIILLYFLHIVIDRWIYIRRNRFAKLMYHLFQVMVIHMWLLIFFPIFTERRINEIPVVQIFYVLKCFYFLFSAYQIRNGYPTIISFHCLWHSYSTFNRVCYTLYRAIPFVLEVRLVLDWMASDSSLGLGDWFKLEDITYRLYSSKCQQESEKSWPKPSGQRVSRIKKHFLGGFMYVVLILAIIFPFLLFSLSSTISKATYPENIKMELYMGSAQPAFAAFASNEKMHILTKKQYKNLTGTFNNIEASQDIFGMLHPEDVLVVKWSKHSLTIWDISPGSREELLQELQSTDKFIVRLEISYTHVGDGGKTKERSFGQSTIVPEVDRQNLIKMVESDGDTKIELRLPLLFPKFLLIKKDSLPESLPLMEDRGLDNGNDDEPSDLNQTDDDEDVASDPRRMRNLLVMLNSNKSKWWQMKEECLINDDNYLYYLKDLVLNDCEEIVLYVFNEKVLPGEFLKFVQYGILGLYIIYFMVIVDAIGLFITKVEDIWLMKLANIDKVLRKCMEVYVARDMKNYELEAATFDELIYIMRSRETLIKLSRYQDNNYDPTFIIPGSSKK